MHAWCGVVVFTWCSVTLWVWRCWCGITHLGVEEEDQKEEGEVPADCHGAAPLPAGRGTAPVATPCLGNLGDQRVGSR